MIVNVTHYQRVTVLAVKEDLVGDVVDVFADKAAQCLQDDHIYMVVDCSEVGGFDSAALEAILDMQNQCQDRMGALKLCCLDATCGKILEVTRLARHFETFEDLESAVKSFA